MGNAELHRFWVPFTEEDDGERVVSITVETTESSLVFSERVERDEAHSSEVSFENVSVKNE